MRQLEEGLGSVIIYVETGYGVGGSVYLICKLLGQIISKVRAFKNERRGVQSITLPTIEGRIDLLPHQLRLRNPRRENMACQLREEDVASIYNSNIKFNDENTELDMSAINISRDRVAPKNNKPLEMLSNNQTGEHSFTDISGLSRPDTHQRTIEPNINQSNFRSEYKNSLNTQDVPSNSNSNRNQIVRILNPSKASLERNAARKQILENVRAMNDPKNLFMT